MKSKSQAKAKAELDSFVHGTFTIAFVSYGSSASLNMAASDGGTLPLHGSSLPGFCKAASFLPNVDVGLFISILSRCLVPTEADVGVDSGDVSDGVTGDVSDGDVSGGDVRSEKLSVVGLLLFWLCSVLSTEPVKDFPACL